MPDGNERRGSKPSHSSSYRKAGFSLVDNQVLARRRERRKEMTTIHEDSDRYVELGSDQAEEEASGGNVRIAAVMLSTADSPASPSQAAAYHVHGDLVEDDVYNDDDDEYADGLPIFASDCEPVIPAWCIRGIRSLTGAGGRKDPYDAHVVFSSPASYHCWNVFLLTIVPICTVLSMALVYTDRTVPHQAKTRDLLLLWMTCVAALLLLFLLLPRRIELYSDSTVAIVSYLLSHEFPHVVDATISDDEDDNFYGNDDNVIRRHDRDADVALNGKDEATAGLWSTTNCSDDNDRRNRSPRIQCATNFVTSVVLRRRSGAGRDIVISPQDPRGMVDAVKRVAQARDAASMRAQVYTI